MSKGRHKFGLGLSEIMSKIDIFCLVFKAYSFYYVNIRGRRCVDGDMLFGPGNS